MASVDGVSSVAEFSPCGQYLACSDSSGALKIWETSTGIKRQQYIPSSHLSATCSCIAWAPKRSAVPSVSSFTSRLLSCGKNQRYALCLSVTTNGEVSVREELKCANFLRAQRQ